MKTWEEMNKMEKLAEIMFQEDKERYNNNQPLIYYTKEDFEAEKTEREAPIIKQLHKTSL